MPRCVQRLVRSVLFLKTIKLRMEFSFLMCSNNGCRKVGLLPLEIDLLMLFFLLVEYSEKIPFVKEAPVEQEAKPAAAAAATAATTKKK